MTNKKISRRNVFGKILVGLLVLSSIGEVMAERLKMKCNSGLVSPYVYMKQNSGASEPGTGPDGEDSTFIPNESTPSIDFYLQNIDGEYSTDARPANSLTDFYARIEGRGLASNVDANLSFSILDDGEGNFDWKNLIVELYDNGEIGTTATKLGTYDAHDLVEGTQTIPALSVHNGLSYQLLIKPRNYADNTSDRIVNLPDFSNISLNWQRNDCSPANTHCQYCDIDRNGGVGLSDLVTLAENWLQ